MTPNQVKAARRLLGWSRDRLAGMSETAVSVVADFERGSAAQPIPVDKLQAVQAALRAAGVEFTEENGGGPGVRLKQPV